LFQNFCQISRIQKPAQQVVQQPIQQPVQNPSNPSSQQQGDSNLKELLTKYFKKETTNEEKKEMLVKNPSFYQHVKNLMEKNKIQSTQSNPPVSNQNHLPPSQPIQTQKVKTIPKETKEKEKKKNPKKKIKN